MTQTQVAENRKFEALNNLLRLEISHARFGPIAGMRWTNRIPHNRLFFIHRLPPGCRDGGSIRNAGRPGSPVIPLRAGCVYFMPCHEEIEGHFREGLSLIAFHFALEAFLGYDVFMGTTDLREFDRQRQVIDDLAGCAGRTLELAEIVRIRGLVHVMAARFIDRSVDDLRRLVSLRGRYRPIFDELESKDGAKATVDRLAVIMGMRRERLSRAFARDMQLPLKSYLIRHLAARACECLAASEEPIGAISRSLAFSSEGYFCRFFRRHIGMTPMRYRRMRQRWQGSG